MPKRKRCPTPAIGDAVEVYWPQDKCYYAGQVHSFNKCTHKFCVLYDDGDVEYLNFEDEQWRFCKSTNKKENMIPFAVTLKRGRTTAPEPDETGTLLEEAHQVVLKVVRKSIQKLRQSKRTITARLVIRTAEDMLCSALTDPCVVLGAEPLDRFDDESSFVMEELKEAISRALENVNSGFLVEKGDRNVTQVIVTSLSIIFAARANT